jgi:transposase
MVTFTNDQVNIQPLDHLGLIAATIDKIGLIEKIDSRIHISKEKGAKVTIGQRVAAMILNGLGFIDDRLYMFEEFLSNKPIDRLFGDTNIEAQHFNDDALGRCLDEIYEYGITKMFSELAFSVGIENNLLGKSAHFDSSTINVYGEYEDDNQEVDATAIKPNSQTERDGIVQATTINSSKKQSIDITYGYSKDHRHDLKQMIINLATTGATGFPIWMEAHNGNASDKVILQAAAAKMKDFCQQLKTMPSFLYVGDSAMYDSCVNKAGDMKWLSRVPETIAEAKALLCKAADEFIWTDMDNGYSTTPIKSNHGDVEQRWLLVFSQQAFERESKTLDRNIASEQIALEKALWHLSKQAFGCEKDARKAGELLLKKIKFHQAVWTISTITKHEDKGRPKKDAQNSRIEYFITGVATNDEERIELRRRAKGRFILATNELNEQKISDAEILPEYKGQSKTESGFRFIKNNAMEVSSIFLKKASRIEALMMIMTLCLMVYSLAQHQLREALKTHNETVPDQRKKPTQNPTMAWVCRLFCGIGVVSINIADVTQKVVANLTALKQRIISYFGPKAEFIYGIASVRV